MFWIVFENTTLSIRHSTCLSALCHLTYSPCAVYAHTCVCVSLLDLPVPSNAQPEHS